ncbi:MAG TPA: choice-of-anchor P family protein [Gemmatimonadales bacterium]|nr:choice-of-anchor P family protein [Gemmatimonadales bacterium]
MTAMNLRGVRAIALAALTGLSGAVLLAAPGAAQTVGGTAYGVYVKTLDLTAQSPVATLPSGGGMSVGDADTYGVPGTVETRWLKAVTTGAVDSPASTAQSTSELENVSILDGLITADVVTAVASSYRNATGAGSDAQGSGFVNLVVNGIALTTDVAPNTRIDLPGIGYVVLNEQTRTASGIAVNMIHVVLETVIPGQCTLLGCTPELTQKVGDIVVGSATSSVN